MAPAPTTPRFSNLQHPVYPGGFPEAAPASRLQQKRMREGFCGRPLLLFVLLATIHIAATAQVLRREPFGLRDATQLIVVTTPQWNATTGELQRYERLSADGAWKRVGHPIAVDVGKNGLGWDTATEIADTQGVQDPSDPTKTEGDIRSPAGIFRLRTTFGYAAAPPPGWRMPYLRLTSTTECIDDSSSKQYNQIVDQANVSSPDSKSPESMLRSDDLYQWGVVIDQNTDQPQPGKGSCTFLHVWAGPGQATVGSTATAEEQVENILGWLDPDQDPVLVQLPLPSYAALQKAWALPTIQ